MAPLLAEPQELQKICLYGLFCAYDCSRWFRTFSKLRQHPHSCTQIAIWRHLRASIGLAEGEEPSCIHELMQLDLIAPERLQLLVG